MKKWIVAVCLPVLVLTACNFEEPDFGEVGNFQLQKLEGSHIECSVDVQVDNPNAIGFKVKKVSADVQMEDQMVGKVKLNEKIKVKRKSNKTYTVPLIIDLENGALITLMKNAGKKEVPVTIKGIDKGSVLGISKKLEFSETKKVNPGNLKSLLGK